MYYRIKEYVNLAGASGGHMVHPPLKQGRAEQIVQAQVQAFEDL